MADPFILKYNKHLIALCVFLIISINIASFIDTYNKKKNYIKMIDNQSGELIKDLSIYIVKESITKEETLDITYRAANLTASIASYSSYLGGLPVNGSNYLIKNENLDIVKVSSYFSNNYSKILWDIVDEEVESNPNLKDLEALRPLIVKLSEVLEKINQAQLSLNTTNTLVKSYKEKIDEYQSAQFSCSNAFDRISNKIALICFYMQKQQRAILLVDEDEYSNHGSYPVWNGYIKQLGIENIIKTHNNGFNVWQTQELFPSYEMLPKQEIESNQDLYFKAKESAEKMEYILKFWDLDVSTVIKDNFIKK